MTADIRVFAGADDHRQCIPAHESLDAFFQREIARIGGLALGRNRIVIRGGKAAGEAQAIARSLLQQRLNNEVGAFFALFAQYAGKRCQPFPGLLGVNVFFHLGVYSEKIRK